MKYLRIPKSPNIRYPGIHLTGHVVISEENYKTLSNIKEEFSGEK